MLSGVGIVCFAASYTVTLALEITRLFFRSGIRGAVMLGFAGAGLFAHTVYLYYRAVNAPGSPLSSSQDWYLVAAWALVVTYLYLTYYHPSTSFGLFILPLILGLIGAGTYLADPEPFAREPASKVWGMIHGVSILLATVALLVGFAAGLMYLGQAYRLKHKLPPRRGLRLPSLEWLQRANSRTIGIAALMLGAGILSGIILNLISYGAEQERLAWNDPVVLSTVVMFVWLVVCAGVSCFYRPAREGHRVASLTMLSFVFLVIALAMVLFGETRHGGAKGRTGKQTRGSRPGEGSGFGVQTLAVIRQLPLSHRKRVWVRGNLQTNRSWASGLPCKNPHPLPVPDGAGTCDRGFSDSLSARVEPRRGVRSSGAGHCQRLALHSLPFADYCLLTTNSCLPTPVYYLVFTIQHPLRAARCLLPPSSCPPLPRRAPP